MISMKKLCRDKGGIVDRKLKFARSSLVDGVDISGDVDNDPTLQRYISRKDSRVTIEYSDQDKHWELKRCEAIWLRAQKGVVLEARVGEGVEIDRRYYLFESSK